MLALKKAIALILAMIAQQQAEMKDFKPLGQITGSDTTVEQPLALMAADQQQLNAIWRKHKDLSDELPIGSTIPIVDASIPTVDFKKNIVIAYFAGQTTGIAGYSIAGIDTKGKTAIVRIAPQPFPGISMSVSNTYGMWVFPRPTKAIELEMITGFNRGQPVIRRIARFEAPKKPTS